MPKSYTEDDLILFIYNELTEREKFSIQKALHASPELYKSYHTLLQVVGSLDTLSYEPHPSSVEIILEHSHHEKHFH